MTWEEREKEIHKLKRLYPKPKSFNDLSDNARSRFLEIKNAILEIDKDTECYVSGSYLHGYPNEGKAMPKGIADIRKLLCKRKEISDFDVVVTLDLDKFKNSTNLWKSIEVKFNAHIRFGKTNIRI